MKKIRDAASILRGLFSIAKGLMNEKRSPFRRFLSEHEADVLANRISSAFETNISREDVQRIASVLRETEKQMVGRIAGDVDDHILNYYMIRATARVSKPSNAAHAEIGVLFGGSLLMTLHALRESASDHKMIAIDPFDGYYGQNADPVTNFPVTIENVRHNIARLGFDQNRVMLVKSKSESVQAIDSVRQVPLLTLWIDGDHSYEGIAGDWRNYTPSIIEGGYILVDNYHDGDYPGVDRFIDEDILSGLLRWEVVTTFGRSILFRKPRTQRSEAPDREGIG